MRQIINSPNLSTDWRPEIESTNLIKKGHYSICFTTTEQTPGSYKIEILNISQIEVNGHVYIAEDNTNIGTFVTNAQRFILTNGLTFSTISTDVFTGSWDESLNGYYYNGSRIIGKFTTTFVEIINVYSGRQT